MLRSQFRPVYTGEKSDATKKFSDLLHFASKNFEK